MKTVGVTVGKFMPLHVGHETMIEMGLAILDELHIIVSGKETDEIPLSTRFNWVYEKYGHVAKVKMHVDDIPMGEKDEHGTVIDNVFWEQWIDVFQEFVPNATHFLSSDQYGQKAAELMGIEWLPVDPFRETIQLSATMIRKQPDFLFSKISNVAKPYFAKVVAIVGPESCGKSVMTKNLASYFSSNYAHEYGRTISEGKNNKLDRHDFYNIWVGQDLLIKKAIQTSDFNNLVFTDTEAYTTFLFSKLYLEEDLSGLGEFFTDYQKIDLYILLAPTVSWVDDGWRILPKTDERWKFFEELKLFLDKNKKNYVIIDDPDFDTRTKTAIGSVRKLIGLQD